jgi:acyl-CoA synthetase (AMP-forming)/AMP-acid ligase II
LKKDLDHFVNIQISSGAQIVLTNSQYNFVKKIENLRSIFVSEAKKWPDLQWIQVDDTLKRGKVKAPSLAALEPVIIDLSDVAFLQYTSGSTSDPKGVMISHLNLAHNLSIIVKELEADTSTVVVSWLPQYHDMGLIGSYLGIVFCGGSGNYLSPISFLKDPVVWVRAISMYKGTHTQVSVWKCGGLMFLQVFYRRQISHLLW